MNQFTYITLRQRPEMKEQAAQWFHQKWGVPQEAYLECMDDYLGGKTEYGWYLCMDEDKIVGGLGVIENDFHDRKDLTPNICAVYTESEYRCKGIAGQLLNMAVEELRSYLLLWFTQMISGLGSAMTAYALVIWSYTQSGLALQTALLMVCSYAPYVLCSIFAGALSDRWNKKKTMLVCDTLAALSTLVVLCLLKNGSLQIWHLYVVNAVSGLMNTVQQPASEVATTALLPKQFYQKVGGLLVDRVFEPIMAIQESGSILVRLFGSGKGSGAAFLFAILWLAGIGVCVIFRADRHIWSVEPDTVQQK